MLEENVEKALKRAAKTARSLAEKTQTPCYVVKDGKIVNVAERETAIPTCAAKAF